MRVSKATLSSQTRTCCEHMCSWRSETHGPRNPVSSFLRHVLSLCWATDDAEKWRRRYRRVRQPQSISFWVPPCSAVGLRQRVCSVVKNPAHAGATVDRFHLWVGKVPWRRKGQPTLVFLPEISHGQRSLEGYHPWGHKELDMTGQLTHSLRIKSECKPDLEVYMLCLLILTSGQ